MAQLARCTQAPLQAWQDPGCGDLRRINTPITLRWYHRQQQVGVTVTAKMQGDISIVHIGGTVVWVVVEVDAAATQSTAFEVAEAHGLAEVLVVTSSHGQSDPIAGGDPTDTAPVGLWSRHCGLHS